MPVLALVAGLVLVLVGLADPLWAQQRSVAEPTGVRLPAPALPRSPLTAPAPAQEPTSVAPGAAALASALLPGTGQHLLGQDRRWVYLGLEALGWIGYFERRSAGGDLRDQYRDFAWERARIRSGQRLDGDFDYYETMTKWTRSGAYDSDPGSAGLQPEADGSTFNGSIWALAQQLFIPTGVTVPETDPRYQRALEYYGSRAYGQEFLWDWTGTGSAQDDFGGLIRSSDDRFRQATNVLGLVLANHLVSTIDAFVSARAGGASFGSQFVPAPGTGSLMWLTRIEWPIPW
ncbi:MAG: hypothetical protein OEN56_11520 [Gemmatimonadota bacterium]|nr:hypothetical protein [Gemmatimonadota bacterium]